MNDLYLSKEFARLARRSGVADDALCEAVRRAERGAIDADLGGGLIKQRVARPGRGRSGGFRTIIFYRRGERAIFLDLFAKNRKASLTSLELEEWQAFAQHLAGLTNAQLDDLVRVRGWRKIEINDDGKKDKEGEDLS